MDMHGGAGMPVKKAKKTVKKAKKKK